MSLAKPAIPASSSPSSKQEDDREWRSRCHLLIGHHNAARSVWFGKYGLVGEAGKPKNLRWGIGAATNWESDTAAYDALAKAPPPPDSKPPTQSEVEEPDGRCSCKGPGHSPLCLGGFAPSPTKPTQSVQPWPEDLSVLVGRTITTRNKCDAPTATRTDVVYRIVDGWIFIDPKGSRQLHIPERDLLSVSPPLSQPQSGQSEGKVRCFRYMNHATADGIDRVRRCADGMFELVRDDGTTDRRGLAWTDEQMQMQLKMGYWIEVPDMPLSSGLVTTSLDSPLPTQPKDSKEPCPITGDPAINVNMAATIESLKAALQSANERAEKAEKNYHDIIMAVAQKFPNETRHETAKRYIIERENKLSEPGQSKAQ